MISYYLGLSLFLFIIFIVLLFYISQAIAMIFFKVPTVGTPKKNLIIINDLLPKNELTTFFDLGSGTGKALFFFSKTHPKINFIGFETSIFAYLYSNLKKIIFKRQNVSFKFKNFFNFSWQKADYIYTYLWPSLMTRVETKFIKETNPKCVLFDSAFKLPNLTPKQILDKKRPCLYLYQKD